MKQDCRPSGFTLLEMLVAVSVLVPVMVAVLSTIDLVGGTLNANDRSSEVVQHSRMLVERLGELFRPAVLSTFKVRATQTDVNDYQAKADAALLLNPLAVTFVPNKGDWIPKNSLDPTRPNLQFQCASGVLSMNAEALTSVRELDFVMDKNELANGIDDDGDGLIDEGHLELLYDNRRIVLADNLEQCTFSQVGAIVTLTLQMARKDSTGHMHRAHFTHKFCPRNN